ncbi:MAG: efflux RND transporter periplasmic adaptor subunit [Clostridiaceae bacterium]|nr:efflux RND transporter periplasmic adaptor subunit [Clostridiaceae bacterium]
MLTIISLLKRNCHQNLINKKFFIRNYIYRILINILLVICIFFLAACQSSDIKQSQDDKKTAVVVTPVVKGQLENYSYYTGIVKPGKIAYVISPISGRVDSEFFNIGDQVKKGDLLFTVDNSEIKDNISILESQLKVAEATLMAAQTGVVAVMSSEYESHKLELLSKLKSAEYNYSAAKTSLDRATIMLETGYISKLQYEEIKNQYNQAENLLKTALESYELYENYISKDTQAAAYDNLMQAEASYDLIKSQLESAKNKLSYTQITSPIDGVVANKDVVEGCMVSNSMVSFTIIDIDTVQVQISVTEQVINKISKGQKINVFIPSVKDAPFEGVVSAVSPSGNPNTLIYDVIIDIPNKNRTIKPGMTAKTAVLTELRQNCITVPAQSILSGENGNFVFTVENGLAIKKPVDTGITDQDRIEIINGLNAGDLLVIKGQHFLNHNDLVFIAQEELK